LAAEDEEPQPVLETLDFNNFNEDEDEDEDEEPEYMELLDTLVLSLADAQGPEEPEHFGIELLKKLKKELAKLRAALPVVGLPASSSAVHPGAAGLPASSSAVHPAAAAAFPDLVEITGMPSDTWAPSLVGVGNAVTAAIAELARLKALQKDLTKKIKDLPLEIHIYKGGIYQGSVEIKKTQQASSLLRAAIKKSGTPFNKISEWLLHHHGGAVEIDIRMSCHAAGLVNGSTVTMKRS
jgi:hypothetical protein